jgi:magnesium transporter
MPKLHVPPGSLIADPTAPQPVITVIAYDEQHVYEVTVNNLDDLPPLLARWKVVWVNVDGLGDANVIQRLGEIFDLHPLALEDVLDVSQRPKVEQYGDQLFIVMRELLNKDGLHSEQFSLFVGSKYVLTFQESAGDALDPVRLRIRHTRGRVRTHGASYLAYALLDAVIDGYFPVLESYGDRLDELEDRILAQPEQTQVPLVHDIKRDLLAIRRAVWPARDLLHSLAQSDVITDEDTRLHLRDAYDHAVRLMDLLESYREIAAALMEVYLSSINNRMNEVIKMLTIISTIFMPLTFIAGVYGMNFDRSSPYNMPELGWRYGYPLTLTIMAVTAVVLLVYFRRRGWIGRSWVAYHRNRHAND